MPKKLWTPAELRDEYQRLWDTMVIRKVYSGTVVAQAQEIAKHKARYEGIQAAIGVPWEFVGVIHSLECSLSFSKHLHCGDPLTARTVRVPKGRPLKGNPPFTWEESALDALEMKGLDKLDDWSIPRQLYELERYNGFGYRNYHPEVLSPYLWSMTNHYTRGKYIADGKWSSTAVSKQVGAAALLKTLKDL